MSEIQKHYDSLNNTTSESVAVRKSGKMAQAMLLDRMKLPGELSALMADKTLPRDVIEGGKRHAIDVNMAKDAELAKVVAEAEADILKSMPKVPQALTAGEASIDAELRALFNKTPKEQQDGLLAGDEDVRMAVARASHRLSGLPKEAHDRVVNSVLTARFPSEMDAIATDRATLANVRLARSMFRETVKTTFATAVYTHADVITKPAG